MNMNMNRILRHRKDEYEYESKLKTQKKDEYESDEHESNLKTQKG